VARGDAARERLRDQCATIGYSLVTGQVAADIELLGDDPATAAELSQESCAILEQTAERAWLSTIVGVLARALHRLDHLDEADAEATRAAELGSSDDRLTQLLWRQTRAKVAARRGNHKDAHRLAVEAVAIGEHMDAPNYRGDSYAALAEVLLLAGRNADAAEQLSRAAQQYDQKGNVVSRDHALERLATLTPPAHRQYEDAR
jgi:ATP/maltotriose-dependent transcriptional regulator MalT